MSYPIIQFGTYVFERPSGFDITGDQRIVETEIPRRDGSLIVSPVMMKSRTISLRERLIANTPAELQTKMDTLRAVLNSGLNALTLYNTRAIYCNMQSFSTSYVPGTQATMADCAITFLASQYPYFYDLTGWQSDIVVLSNNSMYHFNSLGNAPLQPEFAFINDQGIPATSVTITTYNAYTSTSSFSVTNTPTVLPYVYNVDCFTPTCDDFTIFAGNFIQVPKSTYGGATPEFYYKINLIPTNASITVNNQWVDTYYDA